MSDLTPKQERFCREYLIDLNATKAAIRAGYSEDSAAQQASRLLRNDNVREEVARLGGKIDQKLEIKAEDVLREVSRLAMVDISEAFDDNGRLRPIKEIPEDIRRAIAAVEVEELKECGGAVQVGWTKKLKFWDKTKNLELLGKYLKLWAEKQDVTVNIDLAEIIRAAKGKKE